VDTGWSRPIGLAHAFRSFDDARTMVAAFVEAQQGVSAPTYLTIDKDVFAADVARTNWDQGVLKLEHALVLIDSVQPRLIGSDINGEISHYHYRSWWKRRLSAMDEQPDIDPAQLAGWQAQQHALNLQLLPVIRGTSR
jgi:hypothetical protein